MTILASHNSWSYLPFKQWWLRPFAFMAKCQNTDIKTQYEKYGVRCFDLRIRQNKKGFFTVAHGIGEYKIDSESLARDLCYLDSKKDCYVRVLHEVRTKKQYTKESVELFKYWCDTFELSYSNIQFWCGRNLYNWEYDYEFTYLEPTYAEPTCHEDYSSVSKYKYLIGWWPWLYAKIHNKKILKRHYEEDILMIDYINIGDDK